MGLMSVGDNICTDLLKRIFIAYSVASETSCINNNIFEQRTSHDNYNQCTNKEH
jgi:UDP-N-acetylglucosamine enolpyruvyl transferase